MCLFIWSCAFLKVTLKANVIILNLFQFFGNPKKINTNSDSKFRFNIVEENTATCNLKKIQSCMGSYIITISQVQLSI